MQHNISQHYFDWCISLHPSLKFIEHQRQNCAHYLHITQTDASVTDYAPVSKLIQKTELTENNFIGYAFSLTYRPAMDHDEGLWCCVEFTLFDGFWPPGHDVAHVIIRDFGCAQGEFAHDVSEVCDPVCCGRQGSSGDGGVYCNSTHTHTHTHTYSRLLDFNGRTEM